MAKTKPGKDIMAQLAKAMNERQPSAHEIAMQRRARMFEAALSRITLEKQ